jgi:hypothetical protein
MDYGIGRVSPTAGQRIAAVSEVRRSAGFTELLIECSWIELKMHIATEAAIPSPDPIPNAVCEYAGMELAA